MSDILFQRLDKLRLTKNWTWAQVGDAIGVKTAMIMMVKSGKRSLSSKALYRLAQAEREAGLSPPLQVQMQNASRAIELTPVGREENESIAELGEDAFRQIASASFEEFLRLVLNGDRAGSIVWVTAVETSMSGLFMNSQALASATKRLRREPNNLETQEECDLFASEVAKDVGDARAVWGHFSEFVRRMTGVPK